MEENKNLNNAPENQEVEPQKETKVAKKPKKEKLLKNTRFMKRGSYSIALTAIVITAIIVFNVLVSALSDRFVLEFDMTADKVNSISAENVDYIKSIKNDVDIIVCAPEESYAAVVEQYAQQVYGVANDGNATNYYTQTINLINKYNAYNNKLKVRFVDTQSSEFSEITSDYGTDNIEQGGIIVSKNNADGTKRYKKIGFDDIYELEADETYAAYGISMNYIAANNIESALTSGISYVLSNSDIQVAIMTGHTTSNITDSYIKLLKANNYEVDTVTDAYITSIPDKYEVIVFPEPTKDFLEAEINAISKFLENDGKYEKGMMVFASSASTYLPEFYTFLKDWGIEIHDGAVYEPDGDYHPEGDSTILVSANTGKIEDLANMEMCITGNNVPVTPAFEENGNKKTVVVAETMPDTVIAPKGVINEWAGASGQTPNKYATIIEATHQTINTDGDSIASTVTVFSSSYFLASSYNETSAVSNKNLSLAMMDRAANMDDTGISFVPKSITNESFLENVTESSAATVRMIFMIILPISMLALGIVIFVKRRNA